MSAPWVAGDVRAVAISRRTLGVPAARRIAASADLSDALAALGASPYSHGLRPDQSLDAAQRAIAATVLWNVRVLAGWAPRSGVAMLRLATAWYEIWNIEARFRGVDAIDGADGRPEERIQPFELGGLATSWRRVAAASQGRDLREALAATWWGRATDESARGVGLTMRSRLIDRASSGLPGARGWAAGAAVIIVARERLLADADLPADVRRIFVRILGEQAVDARSLVALQEGLPRSAGWVLAGIHRPEDLWLCEGRWWARVEHDGWALLRRSSFGPEPVIGAVAVMAADAWRVRAALEVAARGAGLAEFDALA